MLVDDAACCGQPDDQEHEEENQEQAGEEFRDAERRACDRREPEQGRDDSDYEKHERHVEHRFTLRTEVLPNAYRPERPGSLDVGLRHNHALMDEFLAAAIAEAEHGLREGGIPIGAVLVHAGRILGRGHNRRVQNGSAVLHGEMDALERAGRQAASVYQESVMYTTLSPCAMCSGAILLYGIRRVVVGENRTFMGEEELLRSRGVRVDVVQDPRCITMMKRFIEANPQLWNEDIGK